MKTHAIVSGLIVGFIVAAIIAVGLLSSGCEGEVDVHGIPKSIELQAPFCVPAPKDAGDQ